MATDWPEARALALAAILPAGTDRHIALFLGNPVDGGAELTLTGYDRVAFQDWSTSFSAGESIRSNASDIVWPTITDAGDASYWAIFDSPLPGPGVLLRSGMLLDNLGQPITITFSGLGDEARLTIGTLRIKATEG
jgi:hypothetical protein